MKHEFAVLLISQKECNYVHYAYSNEKQLEGLPMDSQKVSSAHNIWQYFPIIEHATALVPQPSRYTEIRPR